jgi:ribonuclease P protein component
MKFKTGLDIVVIARPSAKGRSYAEIESALLHLAGRHHITGKNNDEEVSD